MDHVFAHYLRRMDQIAPTCVLIEAFRRQGVQVTLLKSFRQKDEWIPSVVPRVIQQDLSMESRAAGKKEKKTASMEV